MPIYNQLKYMIALLLLLSCKTQNIVSEPSNYDHEKLSSYAQWEKCKTDIDFQCDSEIITSRYSSSHRSILYPSTKSKKCLSSKLLNGDPKAIDFIYNHIHKYRLDIEKGKTQWPEYTVRTINGLQLRGDKLINELHKSIKLSFNCGEKGELECQYYRLSSILLECLKPKNSNYNLQEKLNQIFNDQFEQDENLCYCATLKAQYQFILKEIEKGHLIYKEFGEE